MNDIILFTVIGLFIFLNLVIKKLNNKIDKVIEKCEYLLENDEVIINGKKYYKQKCDDIIIKYILQEIEEGDK